MSNFRYSVTVKDMETSVPIQGATVLVYDSNNDIVENLVTDADGKANHNAGNTIGTFKFYSIKSSEYPVGAAIELRNEASDTTVSGVILLAKGGKTPGVEEV